MRAAQRLGRPLHSPDPATLTAEIAASWLEQTRARVVLIAGCRASLLARAGQDRAVRAELAVFMGAARLRHDQLLGAEAD